MDILYAIIASFCAAGLISLLFKLFFKNCEGNKACIFVRGFVVVFSGVVGSMVMKLALG